MQSGSSGPPSLHHQHLPSLSAVYTGSLRLGSWEGGRSRREDDLALFLGLPIFQPSLTQGPRSELFRHLECRHVHLCHVHESGLSSKLLEGGAQASLAALNFPSAWRSAGLTCCSKAWVGLELIQSIASEPTYMCRDARTLGGLVPTGIHPSVYLWGACARPGTVRGAAASTESGPGLWEAPSGKACQCSQQPSAEEGPGLISA